MEGVMVFSRIIDRGDGPKRLFIGGVHGKEGITTIKALKMVSTKEVQEGKLLMYNCPPSSYISTLNKSYYHSRTGKNILAMIHEYEPEIYLELHCYKNTSYDDLTHPDRRYKSGVPPLIELEEKVLIGSISPLIRIGFFHKYDFSFILEMPCDPPKKTLEVYVEIMNMVASSRNRFEILNKLKAKYPSAVEKALKYFLEFSDHIVILFKEVQIQRESGELEDFQSLENFIEKKAVEMDIPITQKQAEQIAQAVQVFSDHTPPLKRSW
jgi:hypothetical protein